MREREKRRGLLTYLGCSGLINKLLSSCYARARDADRDGNRQIEMEMQIEDKQVQWR